ncbi:MAG: M20 family metallopeptidase [Patescibacteria group bacterium]
MKKILEKLIGFKTVSKDKKENKKALEYVEEELSDLQLYKKWEKSEDFSSLILTTKKTKKPKVFLQAHIDVVPGSEDLFSLKEKEGKYIGRGVYDMKFAIACYIKLLKELKDELSNLDLGVMITSDEELGGFNGVGSLVEKGYIGDFCFLPDGRTNWELEEGAKGVIHLKLKAQGKAAHASRPWQGKNAAERLLLFINDLKELYPDTDENYRTTATLTKIHSGKAGNQVPEFAEALVDIRFVPETNVEEVMKNIDSIKKDYIELEKVVTGPSFKWNVNNKYFKKFFQIAKDRYGRKRRTAFSHGSSDARFFASKKIPTLVVKPKGGGHHGPNEWISKEDLERYYQVLKEFVKDIS